MRRVLPFLLLLAAGCGGPAYVKVGHFLPPDAGAESAWRTLSALYVVADVPDPPGDGLLSKAAQGLLGAHPVEVQAADVAASVDASIRPLDAAVLAFRRGTTLEAEKEWLERLEPSGVLEVKIHPPALRIDQAEERRSVKQKDGTTKEAVETLWRMQAGVRATLRLRAYPAGTVLKERSATVAVSGDAPRRGDSPEKDWAEDFWEAKKDAALGLLMKPFFAPYGAGHVTRRRPIYGDKEQPDLKEAKTAARKGDWSTAERLWKARLEAGNGGWRETYNLAVAAESRRDYAAAKTLYAKAKEDGAGGDKYAKPDAALADLERSAVTGTPGTSAAAARWFGASTAVVPFSDETNSIDGPLMLRELVYYALRKGGYNVPHFEDVDAALRAKGFSQGGQLQAAKKAAIAKITGTDRVLFGHLAEFNEVMVGIYGKRVVHGSLLLYDRAEKRPVWWKEEKVLNERAANPGAAAGAFLGQLARGLVERVAKAPLGAETRLFVERILSDLPRKPAR